jgi:hypothetical protein
MIYIAIVVLIWRYPSAGDSSGVLMVANINSASDLGMCTSLIGALKSALPSAEIK